MRNVFRNGEIALDGGTVVLNAPFEKEPEPVETLPDVPLYTGPTADDLRREAEEFKQNWEVEKEAMLGAVKIESAEILDAAKEAAEKLRLVAEDELASLRRNAEEEIAVLRKSCDEEIARAKAETEASLDALKAAAQAEGREAGHSEGYATGAAESERVLSRIRTVLEGIQNKREEIFEDAERQVVELALLFTKKVITVLTAQNRDIVIANIKEALQKIHKSGRVTIKVNTADLQVSTEHKAQFIASLEGAGPIDIMEDSTIAEGGCVVESDFGEIDARISSQIAELESKIVELSPIKEKS
jgi:flagellar assembly protein FliH